VRSLQPELVERGVALRHELHREPELSNRESATAERIRAVLQEWEPDRLRTGVGGHGVLVGFDGPGRAPHILLRCELDALPIDETERLPYGSRREGVSHKCGHDGHMATMVTVAAHLARRRPAAGRVSILFQPAEETGEGAARVRADPVMRDDLPDFALAVHNLPGFPLGSVIVRDGTFAFGSVGADLRLHGAESHAAEPEKGRSPVPAVADALRALAELPARLGLSAADGFTTVCHVRVGEEAFGTAPGSARILTTLRAAAPGVLRTLCEATEELVRDLSARHGLRTELAWREEFPPTAGHPGVVSLVDASARELGLAVTRPNDPFPWSEDFGHFTGATPGALFGLGAGTAHPALHHPAYDFPDELIPIGAALLLRIIRRITSKWVPVEDSFDPGRVGEGAA
jgi:amidohydrolase